MRRDCRDHGELRRGQAAASRGGQDVAQLAGHAGTEPAHLGRVLLDGLEHGQRHPHACSGVCRPTWTTAPSSTAGPAPAYPAATC
jgi:hypothetical protein